MTQLIQRHKLALIYQTYLRLLFLENKHDYGAASGKHVRAMNTPLNPTFLWKNWGMQGYTYFSYFLLQNIDCGYSLEPPRRGGSNVYPQSMFRARQGGSNVYPQSMFRAKIRKISKFFY